MQSHNSKKILFCHFSPDTTDYTPMDIGFVVAILQRRFGNDFSFEIVRLNHVRSKGADRAARSEYRKAVIQRDVDRIEQSSPSAVFLCAESVLWSKVFAMGRAKRVAKALRRRLPAVFIGLQSYKIQPDQSEAALTDNVFDCVVTGNPEHVFLNLPDILGRRPAHGVWQKTANSDAATTFAGTCLPSACDSHKNLDDLPSPYLDRVFDDFLLERQMTLQGGFRAFLVSSRGCGFGCYYCYRSVKFEKVQYFSAKRFYDEMEYLASRFLISRFFVLDDAFLYSKRRLSEFATEFLSRIERNPRMSRVQLFVMARPETIDEEVIDILATLNVICIQIGLQTVNPALQHYMKRTVDTLHFHRIRTWMAKYDMKLQLDIVVGLPGDTADWMKETLRFALLLSPFSMQIKQFYLNPNTLFHVDRREYGIEIDTDPADFDAPYVIQANGIDERYFEETNAFIMEQINDHPQTLWKYLSKKQRFLSEQFYRPS